jgi:hypothetical protein
MEPRELDGRTIIAILVSITDSLDQCAISGVVQWDGSVLSLECADHSLSLPILAHQALPVAAYPVDRLCKRPEDAAAVRRVLGNAQYITFLRVPSMPQGAPRVPEPMLLASAQLPAWGWRKPITGV